MDESTRLLLQDTKDLLGRIEWGGGVSSIPQCPQCKKMKDTRPRGRHHGGCRMREVMRRLDATLEKGEVR